MCTLSGEVVAMNRVCVVCDRSGACYFFFFRCFVCCDGDDDDDACSKYLYIQTDNYIYIYEDLFVLFVSNELNAYFILFNKINSHTIII